MSDNGVPQPIRQFDNTPVPIRLVVLLDVSDSMVKNVLPMREGVEHFLTKLLPDGLMKVGIFGANQGRLERSYTRDPKELKRALPNEVIKGSGLGARGSGLGARKTWTPSGSGRLPRC